jgi:uncharacterized protein YndB with AHSA1/START domain
MIIYTNCNLRRKNVAEQKNNLCATADREIVIERLLEAPRELVFDVWTDPHHVAEWYGPSGFTLTTKQMDVRAGGTWTFTMHGPDGVNYPNKIAFIEVVRPERLIYLHNGDDGKPGGFEVTLTFQSRGAKTLLTMRSVFESAAARDWVVKEHRAIEGANQTLDRFQEQLARSVPRSG